MAETEIPMEDQLAEAIEKADAGRIVALSGSMHPADLASFINELDEEGRQTILACLDPGEVKLRREFAPQLALDRR